MIFCQYYCANNFSIQVASDFTSIITSVGKICLQQLLQELRKEWQSEIDNLKEIHKTDTTYVFQVNGKIETLTVTHFFNPIYPDYRYVEKIRVRNIDFFPYRLDLCTLI